MSKGKQKYIWLYVTDDAYQLPIYICDTAQELADKVGVTVGTVKAVAYRQQKSGKGQYIKVKV